MKKIVLVLSLFYIVSCQKKVDEKTKLFLESVDMVILYSYPSRTMWDTIDGKINEKIRFKNSKLIFDKTKIIDSLILNDIQKAKIYDILLDTKWDETGMQAACYEPRHLFLFHKNDEVIGYYEVCLECGGWDCSKELNKLPRFCIEKGEEMNKLFKQFGLKYIEEKH